MKNHVKVSIAGDEYTIVAEDDENYIRLIADMVDRRIADFSSSGRLSHTSAAILAAVNFADDYQKALNSANNMRIQMKSYLDDTARLKSELNAARSEIAKLKGNLNK